MTEKRSNLPFTENLSPLSEPSHNLVIPVHAGPGSRSRTFRNGDSKALVFGWRRFDLRFGQSTLKVDACGRRRAKPSNHRLEGRGE